jgi:diguanylate cyclase (GGDEF)-like protein/PAS domain S-box-containing protein
VSRTLGTEAYRALYEESPDGVLFTVPDGRVIAANQAACEILRLTEREICSLGRPGLADPTDPRWDQLVAERDRVGHVRGVARMVRGDLTAIEVEVNAKIFADNNGEQRTCTVLRDVTERMATERKLVELTARLREVALIDELTGLRNRRGFVEVSSQILQLADRQGAAAHLLFLDVDGMKELNDDLGHHAGDAALKAVAEALRSALRRADVLARIGGDEFVALTLGLDGAEHDPVEERVRRYLRGPGTISSVGRRVEVSIGWARRGPREPIMVEDLVKRADWSMYRAKASKHSG